MNLTREIAVAAGRDRCAEYDVELVDGHDPRRVAVAIVMWVVYAAAGVGRTFDEVYGRISWTLPGLGAGPAVLALVGEVPVIGVALLEVARRIVGNRKAAIFLAPDLPPESIPGIINHELKHVGDIAAGGLPWCVGYLIFEEFRATEACCFGADASWMVLVLGIDPILARGMLVSSLRGYKLNPEHDRFARALLDAHIASLMVGVDPTELVAPMLEALARHGWRPVDEDTSALREALDGAAGGLAAGAPAPRAVVVAGEAGAAVAGDGAFVQGVRESGGAVVTSSTTGGEGGEGGR